MFVIDETTGKIHLVAMLWNLLALISFEIFNPVVNKLDIALTALESLAKLGNGDAYGNSEGNLIAFKAIERIKQ